MVITKENNQTIHKLMYDVADNHWYHTLKNIILTSNSDTQYLDQQINTLYSAIHPNFPDGGEIEMEVFKNLISKACVQTLNAFSSSARLKTMVMNG